MTIDPETGEPFFFNYKKEKGFTHKVLHQLGPCEAGKFKELAKIEVTPERDDLYGLAFDPADHAEPSRPKGILYAGAPSGSPSSGVGTGEPGQSSLGYVFAPAKGAARKLTVSKSGTGSGTVTSDPAGIDCGSLCAQEFEEGETVTLTATPAEGSSFAGWSGECASTSGDECKVTMSAARSVEASFGKPGRHPNSRSPSPKGARAPARLRANRQGSPAGSSAPPNTPPTPKSPSPSPHKRALPSPVGPPRPSCSPGTCTGTASPCKVTIAAAVELEATFNLTAKPKFKLTVSKSGTGSGTVTSTPSGINCGSGAGCEAEFEEGVEVTLNQAASPGSEFKEWSGACTGSGTCKVTMSAAKSLGAVFSPIPRTLSITKAGTGSGEVKCKLNGGWPALAPAPCPTAPRSK